MILSTQLKNEKSGAQQRSASSSLEALKTQRLHFKCGQATSYDKSDRRFSTTTIRDSIDD
jgi:hypothetical protein